MSKKAMPEPPGSLPDQLTVNEADVLVAGSGSTLLVGYTEEMVLVTVFVRIAAFLSKVIDA